MIKKLKNKVKEIVINKKNIFLKKIKSNKYKLLFMFIAFLGSFIFQYYSIAFSKFKNILSQDFLYQEKYFEVQSKFIKFFGNVKLFFINLSPSSITKSINIAAFMQFISIILNLIIMVTLLVYLSYRKRNKDEKKTKTLKLYLLVQKQTKIIYQKYIKNKLLFLKKQKKVIFKSLLLFLLPYLIEVGYNLLHYFLFYLLYMLVNPQLYRIHLYGGLFLLIYYIDYIYIMLPTFLKVVVIIMIIELILLIILPQEKKVVNLENTKKFKQDPYLQPFGIISGGTNAGKTLQATYTTKKLQELFLVEINEKMVKLEAKLDESICFHLVKILSEDKEVNYKKESGEEVQASILKIFIAALRSRKVMEGIDKTSKRYESFKKSSEIAFKIAVQTELKFILDNPKYFDYLELYYYSNIRKSCIISSYPFKDNTFKGGYTKMLNIDYLDMTDTKTWNIFEAYSIVLVDETSKTLGMQTQGIDKNLFYTMHLDILVSMFSQISGRTGKLFFIDQKLNDINKSARSNAGYMIQITTPVEVFEGLSLKLFLAPFKLINFVLLKFINFTSRTKIHDSKYSNIYRHEISNYKQYLSTHLVLALYNKNVSLLTFMINNYAFLRYKKLQGIKESVDGKESNNTMRSLKIPICDVSDENLQAIFDTSYSRYFYEKNALLSEVKEWTQITPTREQILSTGLYGRFIITEDNSKKKKQK